MSTMSAGGARQADNSYAVLEMHARGFERGGWVLTVSQVLHLPPRLLGLRLLVHYAVQHFQLPLQIGSLRVFRI